MQKGQERQRDLASVGFRGVRPLAVLPGVVVLVLGRYNLGDGRLHPQHLTEGGHIARCGPIRQLLQRGLQFGNDPAFAILFDRDLLVEGLTCEPRETLKAFRPAFKVSGLPLAEPRVLRRLGVAALVAGPTLAHAASPISGWFSSNSRPLAA